MKIVAPQVYILTPLDDHSVVQIKKLIEQAGRVCYKSEGSITDDSYISFIEKLVDRGHLSVIEHANITVKFICDVGLANEIVRHRIASYSQESTRYCNYSKGKFGCELSFLMPDTSPEVMAKLSKAYKQIEESYFDILASGATPEIARYVLPKGLKTELVITTNLREWMHILDLRTSPAAHPEMRKIMGYLKQGFQTYFPEIFGEAKDVL